MHFSWCHTFQQCSNMFKLNKRAKCLSISIKLINMDGIELKPFDVHKSQPITIASLFTFSAIVYSSQHLKCETYNGTVSPRCTLLATLFATSSYEQCCTRLMKALNKCCNTDVLGVLLIYPHSPSGAVHPWDHVYISVKPLSAV